MRINDMSFSSLAYSYNSNIKSANSTDKEDFNTKLQKMRREIREGTLQAPPKEAAPQAQKAAYSADEIIEIVGTGTNPFEGDVLGISAKEALQKFNGELSGLGDFSLDSSHDVKDAIDKFAALYTVYKKHVSQNGSAEEQKQLEDIFAAHVDRYAKSYGKEVGGFFEKNGMENEVANLHSAVTKRIYKTADRYADFIDGRYMGFMRSSPFVFSALGDDDLDKGIALSSQLIRGFRESGGGESFSLIDSNDYTRLHLSTLADMVKHANKIDSIYIKANASDVDIGTQLGKMKVEAQLLLDTSFTQGRSHKNIFAEYINSKMDKTIDMYDKERSSRSNKSEPANRSTIYSIVQNMQKNYENIFEMVKDYKVKNRVPFNLYEFSTQNPWLKSPYGSSTFWNDFTNKIAGLGNSVENEFSWHSLDIKA